MVERERERIEKGSSEKIALGLIIFGKKSVAMNLR